MIIYSFKNEFKDKTDYQILTKNSIKVSQRQIFNLKNKDTESLNSTNQEIYQQHLLLYENLSLHQDFLDNNFPGLKNGDDVLTLLATISSRSPDSTVAVRAANELSVPFKKNLIVMNSELQKIIEFKGVADLKNCYHYFSGLMTQYINNLKGSFYDANYICNFKILLTHATTPPIYWSDSHISVFLRLLTSGKDKIAILALKFKTFFEQNLFEQNIIKISKHALKNSM